MKKLNNNEYKSYKYLTLYLENILEIYEVLQKESEKIYIKINNYELDSINEISEIPKTKITYLRIAIQKPYYSLTLEQNKLNTFFEDDVLSLGINKKIETILLKHKNRFRSIVNQPLVFTLAIIIDIFFGLMPSVIKNIQDALKYSMFCFQLISILIIIINIYYVIKPNNVRIFLEYQGTKISFFKRQKDSIILAILSAITGALLTLIVELIVKK